MKTFSLKNNWMSIVMLVSLLVNFFVIGFIYAQHKANEIRMTRLAFDNSISRIIEPLPRKGKHEFYVTMRSKRSELIPIYRNIMDQRSTIMTIIAEEQFDGDKLRSAMQEYHNSYHAMIGSSQDVIISIINGLEATERKAILEKYKSSPPRRNYRGRDERPDRNRRSNSSNNNSRN